MLLAAASARGHVDEDHGPFELNSVQANSPLPLRIERERIESELSRMEGRHLVIVNYDARDIPGEEWIVNQPDLRSAKIIWARDMGTAKNEELIKAYPGRHVWFAYRSQPWRPLERASDATAVPLGLAQPPGR